MHEPERLSALIGDIYDAALDPTLWVNVLGKTRAFIGGWAIALSWKDAVAKCGGSYFEEGGQDPYYHRLTSKNTLSSTHSPRHSLSSRSKSRNHF